MASSPLSYLQIYTSRVDLLTAPDQIRSKMRRGKQIGLELAVFNNLCSVILR